MPDRQLGAVVAVALVVGALVGGGAAFVALPDDQSTDGPNPTDGPSTAGPTTGSTVDSGLARLGSENVSASVSTFESEAAFERYVRQGSTDGGQMTTLGPRRVRVETTADVARSGNGNGAAPAVREESVSVSDDAVAYQQGGGGQADRRTSSTNVQVAGIDEPDILKTAGERLYYARQPRLVRSPRFDDAPEALGTTHVFDTSNPARPGETAVINTSGDLLRTGDRLVVFEGDRLVGYDVSNPDDPEQTWTRPVEGTIETARLLNGSVYLVTSSSISAGEACSVEPLGEDAAIPCTSIHHPDQQVNVDATYSAFRIDPSDGAVTDNVSFVGTAENTAVYMSPNALYLTYTQQADRSELVIEGLLSSEIDTPLWVDERLREVRSYNLSSRAQSAEVDATIQQWIAGLDEAERNERREDIRESIRDYVEKNRRSLTTTGVARVTVGEEMAVDAVGTVPGEPLNQFSMSEHEGTLRIATTVPRQFGLDSENDLYTLEADTLERKGEVTGMGIDQRVFAVRYVGETAYVVTFRQIDPFHVVDLSDPTDPEEVGELELPGFSSYLHPVDENHVLGVGQENGEPKAVLFDVSDPSDPTIDDTYFFDAEWSAIDQSHHAFLMDRRHGVFFLPGDSSGFVVDYTDSELSLQKEVEVSGQPQRAAYVGDHMYVFSDRELAVVDETDWSVVNRTSLVTPTSEEPAKAVESFIGALDAADADAIEAPLHPDSEAADRIRAFLTDEESMDRLSETELSVVSVDVVSQSGGTARVEATVVSEIDGDEQEQIQTFTLRRESGEWLIWDWR